MGMSILKLLLIVLIIFLIFGAGKLPKVMGDLGKGLKSFKKELEGDKKTSDVKDVKPEGKIIDVEAEEKK